MLECLEFRDEKNSLGGEFQQYGKFAFSRLEKGQGLTVANTLRRVLLYELPAVGITSVLISNRTSERAESKTTDNQKKSSLENRGNNEFSSGSLLPTSSSSGEAKAGTTEGGSKNEAGRENLSTEIPFLSEIASSHHEFSTLPGVKESVLEILFNLKSVVFENIFSYSSIQKGTLALRVSDLERAKVSEISNHVNKAGDLLLSRSVERGNRESGGSLNASSSTLKDYKIRASQLILPSEIRIIHPNQILATLTKPETTFELEFTIEKITQSDLTSTSSFSGRAPNRSTRNRRILPIDGTIFPVKKVNYTIEQDSFGKEIVFFEIWTNGGLHPRDAIFQSIEKVIKLFQTFQE